MGVTNDEREEVRGRAVEVAAEVVADWHLFSKNERWENRA